MPAKKTDKIVFCGTGRRKKSIARVRLISGNGNITVNKKNIDEYFGVETLKVIVRQPLAATSTLDKYDIICKVIGGGISRSSRSNKTWYSKSITRSKCRIQTNP